MDEQYIHIGIWEKKLINALMLFFLQKITEFVQLKENKFFLSDISITTKYKMANILTNSSQGLHLVLKILIWWHVCRIDSRYISAAYLRMSVWSLKKNVEAHK